MNRLMIELALLIASVMQIVESSQYGTRSEDPAEEKSLPRWMLSQSGEALVLPLATSTSASSLDLHRRRSLTSLNNVRTKLSDGLARHG